MKNSAEFNGERARLYELALTKFPNARKEDLEAMLRLLNPQRGERILGVGEGNGYFCKTIAEAIGPTGYYFITDPSKDQLKNLVRRINLPQVAVQTAGAEELEAEQDSFDKIWCFGAFHHCPNQTEAMKRMYKALRPQGKLVLCDVFQESVLAGHFDAYVARYCETGHEVKFLSQEFAESLYYLSGFEEKKIQIQDLLLNWHFASEHDLGEFVNNLHAMTLLPGSEEEKIRSTIESWRHFLGIKYDKGVYKLNWPLKVVVAVK